MASEEWDDYDDEPEYVEEEDLHEHDYITSTAARHAAVVAATQVSQQPSAFEDGEFDSEEDEDAGYGTDIGDPGPSGQLGAESQVSSTFDPAALENILSGQEGSTPIFNQLFGAIDYAEDEEDIEDQDMEELEAQMDFESGPLRKRRRRKQRSTFKGGKALTDEQSRLLGEANMAYTQGQYSEAIRFLHQIIRSAPYAHQAWFTLAMIHEELEDSVKALQFYLIAAHLTPKDAELWKRLGEMSTRANQLEQAIYCYNKAIRLNKNDVLALTSRSAIYQQLGQNRRAVQGYKQVLKANPDDMTAVKELAKLYLALKQPRVALSLFDNALALDAMEFGNEPGAYNAVEGEESDEEDQEQGWVGRRIQFEEINMIAELYMETDEYELAIDFIKKEVRKLQGRWGESGLWDASDNDDEYGEAVEDAEERLPLELRVKLGICRLWTDELDLARQHFNVLRRQPVDQFYDLYYDVADAYIDKKMFEAAADLLDSLAANESTNTDLTWARQAACARELGDLDKSAELFEKVVAVRAGDIDSALELAQIYMELGDNEQAMRVVTQVEEAAATQTAANDDASQAGKALIESGPTDTKASQREQAKRAEEEQAQLVNRASFQRCKLLWASWNESAATEAEHGDLLRTARKLIQKFQTTKAFYPSDRGKKFTGLGRRKRGSKASNSSTQQAVNNLVTRLRNSASATEGNTPPANVTSFQGLSFDEWHNLFIMYAIALARKFRTEEAQMVLQSGIDANVFYHDEDRLQKLKMIAIAIGLQSGDLLKVAEVCRWFVNHKPYKNDAYRLFSACLSGGPDSVSAYAQATVQKAFQRLMRILEGRAKKAPDNPEHQNPVLVSLYGHILLAARSYATAISTYLKAYQMNDGDPLINLSLGIAFIHRAMNRQTDNRHLQIVQGFTFLFKYYDLKGGNEEACYNIARAFHQIGLFHLAIPYYEKVLAEPDQQGRENHKREAAYNLCGIYMSTGSAPLAHMVMREYCVV